MSSSSSASALASAVTAAELLRIDVASELRTLSEAQLQGPWQAPAELVRQAVAGGAGSVVLTINRRGFTVSCPGFTIPEPLLGLLAVAIDSSQPLPERHAAIVGLEQARAEPLLWTSSLAGATVRLASRSSSGTVVLHRTPSRPPQLAHEATGGRDEVTVRVWSLRFEMRRAVAWVHTACRFAPVPVTVNGTRLSASFSDGLFRMALRAPLPGVVGITATGDAPKLWLLRHGVLVTRATVPGYPAFHAALEMAQVTRTAASAAALREAVTPYLTAVIDQAIGMLIRLAGQLREMEEKSRQRVTSLLLQAAQLGLRRSEVIVLELVKVLGMPDRPQAWLSLQELAGLASASSGLLFALDPGQRSAPFSLTAGPVVMASTEERALLGDLVPLHFQTPPLRRWQWSLGSAFRGLVPVLARALRRIRGRLGGLSRPRSLQPDELTEQERSFLIRIEDGLAPVQAVQVCLCLGDAPPHRFRDRFMLPRSNQLVQHCLQAVTADPNWLYPVLLVLLDGSDFIIPSPIRSHWLRHCLRRVADSREPG